MSCCIGSSATATSRTRETSHGLWQLILKMCNFGWSHWHHTEIIRHVPLCVHRNWCIIRLDHWSNDIEKYRQGGSTCWHFVLKAKPMNNWDFISAGAPLRKRHGIELSDESDTACIALPRLYWKRNTDYVWWHCSLIVGTVGLRPYVEQR